jgi:serine protease Do
MPPMQPGSASAPVHALQAVGSAAFALLLLLCSAALSAHAANNTGAASAKPKPPAQAASAPLPLTGAGQRIYERTRPALLQVRTLLKTQDSQSSVGSGFLVDDKGHLITNYHVVSQYALQPTRHRLVYATVDGKQGALQLLAFDALHDLALLRVAEPAALAGRGAVALRPADEPLPRGARIFSMGNPLDVGFAVAEGNYNGPTERSFLPTLFFGGSLSGGMSGGPALDELGRLIGVNVAARRDGEQVSFLVPAEFVRALIARVAAQPDAAPIATPVWPELTRQLLAHEANLTERFMGQAWREAGHPNYRIPVPQETFMRCWGQGSPQAVRGLQFERSDCEMDSRVFLGGSLMSGYITVRHEAYDGSKLGTLRFAQRYSGSFRNEFMGFDERQRTASQCVEKSVVATEKLAPTKIDAAKIDAAKIDAAKREKTLPLKAVVCLRAYKKLEGLHDLSVLVATLDHHKRGVQGRFDAHGVSLASAQRLAAHYLNGFAWTIPQSQPTPPAAPRPAASR